MTGHTLWLYQWHAALDWFGENSPSVSEKFCFEATYSPERRAAIFPELMAQSMEGWKEARSGNGEVKDDSINCFQEAH